ncbi:MAG TPA: hypothetical protein VG028_07690 [Terriglobia bacterium]|nr:hypothetical protein [Terriglobia bacterium]
MTIEDLERGMKMLFDQQVQFAHDFLKAEQRQDRTDLQIAALTGQVAGISSTVAEITGSQTLTMKAITSVVAMIGELTESQKRTEASVAELAESQKRTDAIVAALGRRIDAYIAAQGNGHQKSP